MSTYCLINTAILLLQSYVHYLAAMPTASITALMPSSSTPEVTSFQVSASIIGGAMGGALILVILLLVLVVIIAAVLVRRRKAAVQSLQLEVLAR